MAVLDASDFSWMKQRAGNDAAIPEILAGPVLRRGEPGGVSVWLATKTKGSSVNLLVTDPTGATVASTPMDAPPPTTSLGDNLNVVLATAVPTGQPLQPGVQYQYTLSVGQQSSAQPTAQTLATALGLSDLSQLCYGTDQQPSFALPPQDLSKLSLVHASCRHAGSDSLDALPVLDGEIANLRSQTPDDASLANARPHQMWLTGDQIYGDDLSDPWLALCIDLGGWLMGNRTEPYPKLLRPTGPNLAIELPATTGLEPTRNPLERSQPLAGYQFSGDRRPGVAGLGRRIHLGRPRYDTDQTEVVDVGQEVQVGALPSPGARGVLRHVSPELLAGAVVVARDPGSARRAQLPLYRHTRRQRRRKRARPLRRRWTTGLVLVKGPLVNQQMEFKVLGKSGNMTPEQREKRGDRISNDLVVQIDGRILKITYKTSTPSGHRELWVEGQQLWSGKL